MDVGMTIRASQTDLPELPPFGFLVAGKTRSGQVGSIQPECTGIVLLHRKTEFHEPVRTMTRRTIRSHGIFHKLALVIIGMAVCTAAVPERIGQVGLMARPAIDGQVPAFQFESRLVVIKFIHAFHQPEGFFVMALPAILPELVFVNIRVATGAVGIQNSLVCGEFLAVLDLRLVALYAFHRDMLSPERETGIAVIEAVRRFEPVEIVAFSAFPR
jgi:hypothetical protein